MRALLLLPVVFALSGCNWFNHVTGLSKDADKAIGAACRQTGRSLEECYRRNPDADKAQVFAGWREMHEYMTKQHLPTMSPPPDPPPPPPPAPAAAPAANKTSDAAPPQQPQSDGADDSKPDPEVQAVLDTINNKQASNGAQPNKSDQQLQQMLDKMSKTPNQAAVGTNKKAN